MCFRIEWRTGEDDAGHAARIMIRRMHKRRRLVQGVLQFDGEPA
jgi:hypothetical protein